MNRNYSIVKLIKLKKKMKLQKIYINNQKRVEWNYHNQSGAQISKNQLKQKGKRKEN